MHTQRQFGVAVLVAAAVALLLGGVGESHAGFIFSTPAGIAPGQQFIVVFLDSTGGAAASTDITNYDNAVSNAASGITYSGGTIGSWSIIGATASSDAAANLFSSSLAVYDLDGNLLASSGSAYLSSGSAPSIDQNGNQSSANVPVFTGLGKGDTAADPMFALGGPNNASIVGLVGNIMSGDGLRDTEKPEVDTLDYYGYATFTAAPAVTAVPEPSGITLALVGLVVSAVARVARRRPAAARG